MLAVYSFGSSGTSSSSTGVPWDSQDFELNMETEGKGLEERYTFAVDAACPSAYALERTLVALHGGRVLRGRCGAMTRMGVGRGWGRKASVVTAHELRQVAPSLGRDAAR